MRAAGLSTRLQLPDFQNSSLPNGISAISMNKIQEKIKDLVDVRSNEQLEDLLADLGQTLSGYYFTDITSDLMSKWIDRVVVMPTGSRNAYALAGYRGVGKSHFLAAFGAILSQPDLRAKLKDSHVFASAERLIRRHYPVVNVRRGTKETFIEELRAAMAEAFEVDISTVGQAPADIVALAAEKGGAGPSVLVIDTDIEREARVSRDDGAVLSELAKCAENTNVFIAVALDDDVAGADGRNSGIAQNFTIDYLDHEHLYKIIDANIFPKNNAKRAVITAIYENCRQVLPSFRWSQQRMSFVYPLHPVILEVAPFVRLFIQDFALLAFASQAGAKTLNRPADSLIALDELFDTVEKSLRESKDLGDVFSSYDKLNESIISKVPVMERLRAKLVLKGLLLLSLDSEGATASDIAAAMLIFDEKDPLAATVFVEALLEKFIDGSEGQLWKMEREGRAAKYGFNLSGKEHFNTALSEAVQIVPDSVIPQLLKRLTQDRYADCEFVKNDEGIEIADTVIEWRGGIRHGRLIWKIGFGSEQSSSKTANASEWEILVDFDGSNAGESMPFIRWKPDALKPEEFDTLKRYHALMSREDLQQSFRDEVRTAIQTYTIALEKLWERKFLQYGTLLIDGTEKSFTPTALSGHNLSEVLGEMLAPHMEAQFPEHPVFGGRLDLSIVDELSTGLFSSRGSIPPDVRKLAENFAVPLGLAELTENSVEVKPVEGLLGLHSVSALMEMVATTDGPLRTSDIHARLGSRPLGLTFESQCLIMAALVARGVVEFVTKNGDRIGSRSLDLKLVWDDVAGIAMPGHSEHSDDQLVKWAVLLTGNDKLNSISSEAARQLVHQSLSKWLEEWRNRRFLELLESVSDDLLTTELWHIGARIKKSFAAAAEAVYDHVSSGTDLESALRSVKESFSGSEDEFASRSLDLETLESLLNVIPLARDVRSGIAVYEPTDDSPLEKSRRSLVNSISGKTSAASLLTIREIDLRWNEFRDAHDQVIRNRHEASSRSHEFRDRANEILESHIWWVYENLSDVDEFPTRFKRICRDILRELRKCNCTNAVVTESRTPAFCPSCAYSGKTDRVRRQLCLRLWETINQALVAYDHVLGRIQSDVIEASTEFAASSSDELIAEGALSVGEKLRHGVSVADYSENELKVLILILRKMRLSVASQPIVEESLPPVITGEEIVDDAVVSISN